MRLNIGDSNLVLNYLQIKLKESYNPNITVTGDYYESVNNKYGFAHYVAKYLNMMYPPLFDMDEGYDSSAIRDVSQEPISIMNYFLCDNKGHRLDSSIYKYKYYDGLDNDGNIEQKYNENYGTSANELYAKIYSRNVIDMIHKNYRNDCPIIQEDDWTAYNDTVPKQMQKVGIIEDPVGGVLDVNTGSSKFLLSFGEPLEDVKQEPEYKAVKKSYEDNKVYKLSTWETDKNICEIDDLVLSYLMGRTITPDSSKEDIYYVQHLLIEGRLIDKLPNYDKGLWKTKDWDLTQLIMEYQKEHFDKFLTHPLFITGYFDIFTEAVLLRDRGEQSYGIRGL